MIKLFTFVPCYREMISAVTFDATHNLMSHLMQRGMQGFVSRYSWFDIAELRNVVLSYFHDCTDATHMLFIDDDVGFPPECVTDMIAFNEPVVGALYRKRSEKMDWAASGLAPGTAQFRGRSFLEVEGLGAGCFLIRRDAVERMIAKFPELIRDHVVVGDFQSAGLKRTLGFFDYMMSPQGKVSEDISFCRRWREAGGQVWANTAHSLIHVGMHEFRGSYAQWRMEEDGKALASKPDVKVPMRTTVKAKHGDFIVNPNDTFIGRSLIEYGEWCEFEIDLLSRFLSPGDTVIDVGANIGTHAIAFAKMVGETGRVVAFEPQPRLADTLTANAALNHLDIEINRCAISFKVGSLTMAALPPDEVEFNFGALPLIGPPRFGEGSTVSTMTIDALGVLPRLIKIDVEGMEPEVIRGAVNTVKDAQPVIYLECNGDDTSAIDEVLHEIGYRAYWSIGPYFNPRNHFGNPKNVWPNVVPSANLLAIPSNAAPLDMPLYLGPKDNWKKACERMTAQAAE